MGIPLDLDPTLLRKMMRKLKELTAQTSRPSTEACLDLVSDAEGMDPEELQEYVNKHADFLADEGYVRLGERLAGEPITFHLKSKGRMFLQPELAEFGQASMLPDVIMELQKSVDQLTIPESEKDNFMFRVRKAFVEHLPRGVVDAVFALIEYKIQHPH